MSRILTTRLAPRIRNTAWRLLPLLVAGATLAIATPFDASADSSAPAYHDAVSQALSIVEHASPGDVTSVQQAASILRGGTGTTQPEILADLAKSPPDLQDATTRLRALLDALDRPATTADPAQAQAKLHDVLAMHRYDALHRPPSLLDRFSQWVQDRIRQILRLLFGSIGPGGVVPAWAIYAIGVAIMVAVAIVVFRATAGRVSGGFAASASSGPREPADFFAEADRLAAHGDRVAAIRALCAGVAATLAGERTWEGSPLTVREIFQRAPDPGSLRPLLAPFEAAVYGGRDVDVATYERAARVAEPFRASLDKAAA